MDTALRNRLTGAVILVLLAVLLLPELLTGSGRTPAPTTEAAGAAGDGPPKQTYRVDLTDAASAPPGVAPVASASTPASSPGADDAPVELPVPAAAAPSAAAAAPPTGLPAVSAAAPDATPGPPPPAIVAAPPVASPPAVTAMPPSGAGTVTEGRRFFVQVGTFATRERAEVLYSGLVRRGFQVVINETARDDQRFYRVRVGPVADRKAAEALEVRLRPLAPDRAIVALP